MKIDSYSFGRIVIGGRACSSDVIIAPGGVRDNWWRSEGHLISLADIQDSIGTSVRTLIIGTGASGMCRVAHDLEEHCRKNGIDLIAEPTSDAVARYNALADKSSTVVALHLTC